MKRLSVILFVSLLLLGYAWGQESHAIHFARLTATATPGGQVVLPPLSYYPATGGVKLPATPKPSDYASYQELDISCLKEGVTTSSYYTDEPRLYLYAKPDAGYELKGIYNEHGERLSWTNHTTRPNLYYYDWFTMTSGYNPGTLDRFPIELNLQVEFAPASSTEQTLVATPRAGHEFIGWMVTTTSGDNRFVSFSENAVYYERPGESVSPIYHSISDQTPYFAVGDRVFSSLTDACDYAVTGGYHKVVLVGSGVLSEDATIPYGIQLVIPHDGSLVGYQYWVDYGHTEQYGSAYRTLQIADGHTLTVEGTISVSARQASLSHAGCGPSSTVYGDYGLLLLGEGATLQLNSGAELYAYGYISGPGQVEVLDGATVYEMFQVMDWRGVGYMMDNIRGQLAAYQQNLETFNTAAGRYMAGEISWEEVIEALPYPTQGFQYIFNGSDIEILPKPFSADMIFPMNQYYIQNVESRMLFHYGAVEKLSATLNASMDIHFDPFTLIGADEGLFRLEPGAVLTKFYDCDADRQVYELQGRADIESISLTSNLMQQAFGFVTPLPMTGISSELYTLPIAHNMSIHLLAGTEAEIHHNVCMLPGSSLIIDEDATLQVGPYANVYVYDDADWNVHNFAGSGDYISIDYTYCGGLTADHSPQPEAPSDASILVNGTLEVLAGTIGWETISQNTDWEILEALQMQLLAAGIDPSTYQQEVQGAIYTSQAGANIYSTGTGEIVQQGYCGAVPSVSHNSGTNGADCVAVDVYPALLKNADGSYKSPTCDMPTRYSYDAAQGIWRADNDDCERDITASAETEGTGTVLIEIVDEQP